MLGPRNLLRDPLFYVLVLAGAAYVGFLILMVWLQ
jgi:hypothetical protein